MIAQTIVFQSASRAQCEERALVLVAVGIECELLLIDKQYALVVTEDDAKRAREQIEHYTKENRVATLRLTPRALFSEGLGGAAVYGVILLTVDILRGQSAFSLDWLDAGAANAGLIQQGEWWRCITALSLHSNMAHLLGNLFFGILLGLLVSQVTGYGIAWLAILSAGALGNAMNAILYHPYHISIGASTAVFGALGTLAVHAWLQRRRLGQSLLRRWLPIGSALALLAFMGTAGERTDVLAHLAGFIMGAIVGVAASFFTVFVTRVNIQRNCAAISVVLVIVAWWIALANSG